MSFQSDDQHSSFRPVDMNHLDDQHRKAFIDQYSRRDFVRTAGSFASAGIVGALLADQVWAEEKNRPEPEQLVKKLYRSLTPSQKQEICFDWNHQDDRGLLRTHVSNNWSITDRRRLNVGGQFFTADQRDMIEAIFFGLYHPDWHDRIRKQLQDDAGGYGKQQTIALFGNPDDGKFELVMTGRHLTVRCDGNSAEHVAFGGPIFYGHAAQGFNEKPNHPGNVFWPQALQANKLYEMLDGKQREQALIKVAPFEWEVGFGGKDGKREGIQVTELAKDQKEHLQGVLATLLEPYRLSDREEAYQCLKDQGGLDSCSISFYQEGDLGNDGIWDIWRLEGPSFVWHYRGAPHVHVWVNIANDPNIDLNAAG